MAVRIRELGCEARCAATIGGGRGVFGVMLDLGTPERVPRVPERLTTSQRRLSSRWIRSLQASDFSSVSKMRADFSVVAAPLVILGVPNPGERAKVLLGEEAYEAAYREGTALAFDALIAEARWPG